MYSKDLELYARTTRGKVERWNGTRAAMGLTNRTVFIVIAMATQAQMQSVMN